MQAYSALSKVYEYLILDCDYIEWSQYLLSKLKGMGNFSTGIDCACGSGIFTRALASGGYQMTGVDLSAEMLTEAVKNSVGYGITYLNMDMSKLKSLKKVDFITVVNDGVNYLDRASLQRAFKAFYSSLKKGGVIYFDMSSQYKLEQILANNMFGEDTEKCSYLWFNRLGDGFVDFDIVLFERQGELYKKSEETHRQYVHKIEEVVEMLKSAGFENVCASGHMGKPLTSKTERVEFTAQKV